MQASTPHEPGEVTGEATHVPISKPDDQSTVRAHEELPINSEGQIGRRICTYKMYTSMGKGML